MANTSWVRLREELYSLEGVQSIRKGSEGYDTMHAPVIRLIYADRSRLPVFVAYNSDEARDEAFDAITSTLTER